MTSLFETIKIIDGEAQNLEYHQKRFDRSRSELFGSHSNIDLLSLIETDNDVLLKCKIIYAKDIISIEYTPYKQKEFKKFIVLDTEIEYGHKYSDRDYFDNTSKKYNEFDDIIFCKNGLLSDTTIANIAFLKDGQWATPTKPLLAGTTRARLIESGFLVQKDIMPNEISNFDGFAIMNALIGFHQVFDFNIKGKY